MYKGSCLCGKVVFEISGAIKNIERPEAHVFVASKASWETLTDDLPKYECYE